MAIVSLFLTFLLSFAGLPAFGLPLAPALLSCAIKASIGPADFLTLLAMSVEQVHEGSFEKGVVRVGLLIAQRFQNGIAALISGRPLPAPTSRNQVAYKPFGSVHASWAVRV